MHGSMVDKQRGCWFERKVEVLEGEGGSQLLELALVLPLFFLLFAATVDFGRLFYVFIEVASAAEAGAIYGLEKPTDVAGMQAAASLSAPDLTGMSTVASYGSECPDGSLVTPAPAVSPICVGDTVQYVEVDTKLTYSSILWYPGIQQNFTLTGTSRMRAAF